MFATMYAAQGIGLAAPPDSAKSIRIAVVDVTGGKNPEAKIVLVNPQIIAGKAKKRERKAACRFRLSGYVVRPQFVTIKAQDAKGEPLKFAVKICWHARSAMKSITSTAYSFSHISAFCSSATDPPQNQKTKKASEW